MEWSMLLGFSVHNVSLPLDHTCWLDKSELQTCLRFLVSKIRSQRQQSESFFIFLLLSHSSIRCCPLSPRASTQHTNFSKKKKHNLHVFVSRLVGFSGYILALRTSASSGCSSSSFPISTSSRCASIGSMSSPIVSRIVFRFFVGLASALLCHTRVPLLRIVHNVGFCGLHFFPQREIEDVVFDVDWTELFSSIPTHQSFEMHPHFMDNFAVHWNHETTAGS